LIDAWANSARGRSRWHIGSIARKSRWLSNKYGEVQNEPYAIAKIAGIELCESYNRQFGVDCRSVMPTNLYGPGDNFHPEKAMYCLHFFAVFMKLRATGVMKW
jgi:nucleoside-diphosphate-sugar epimerase